MTRARLDGASPDLLCTGKIRKKRGHRPTRLHGNVTTNVGDQPLKKCPLSIVIYQLLVNDANLEPCFIEIVPGYRFRLYAECEIAARVYLALRRDGSTVQKFAAFLEQFCTKKYAFLADKIMFRLDRRFLFVCRKFRSAKLQRMYTFK